MTIVQLWIYVNGNIRSLLLIGRSTARSVYVFDKKSKLQGFEEHTPISDKPLRDVWAVDLASSCCRKQVHNMVWHALATALDSIKRPSWFWTLSSLPIRTLHCGPSLLVVFLDTDAALGVRKSIRTPDPTKHRKLLCKIWGQKDPEGITDTVKKSLFTVNCVPLLSYFVLKICKQWGEDRDRLRNNKRVLGYEIRPVFFAIWMG